MKKFISLLISVILIALVPLSTCTAAETYDIEVDSSELIIMVDALIDKITHDDLWFDGNGDGQFNILDFISLKMHLCGLNKSYSPIKYVDIYYDDYYSNTEINIVRQYTNTVVFPNLPNGYKYWMIGSTGYKVGKSYTFPIYRIERHIYAVKNINDYIVV